MKKPTLRQKIKYEFDNLMSKGTISLLVVLGIITAVVVITGGLIAASIGGPDGKGEEPTGSTIWFTLMHAINTGVLAKEEGTAPYLFVMTVVTLVGIFITSFLIGTISNGIKEKVTDLQRGKSRVIENGHIILIGFNDNTIAILEELILAAQNKKREVIVVFDAVAKTVMEEKIRDKFPESKNIKIICRSGRPDAMGDLEVCSLDTCRTILINLNDDFVTTKTLLACEALLNDSGNKEAYITTTVKNKELLHPAQIAAGSRAEVLNFNKIMARLITQSGRHPGMSDVISELLSFNGNEVYVEKLNESQGFTIDEINLMLPNAIAIGIMRDMVPMINPKGVKIKETDEVIIIAKDDNITSLSKKHQVNQTVKTQSTDKDVMKQKTLIIGQSDLLDQILIEENKHSANGSEIIIAVEGETKGITDRTKELNNIKLDIRRCNIYSRAVLENLVAEEPTGILLLSNRELEPEDADARVIMLQLQLNDITERVGRDIPLTIEINNTHNQRLSQMMRATDFVISSKITSKMMTQIAEDRRKKEILDSLLSESKTNIKMEPIERYISVGEETDFFSLKSIVSDAGDIVIGYKTKQDDNRFTIILNPDGHKKIDTSNICDLIVVS